MGSGWRRGNERQEQKSVHFMANIYIAIFAPSHTFA